MKPVVSGRWSVVSGAEGSRPATPVRRRPGITLTEILIAIMILGVGLVSLATLFPIGLLRLRDAARWSRSATLLQTAASDAISRGLFSSQSFQHPDMLNYQYSLAPYNLNLPLWYSSLTLANPPTPIAPLVPPIYNPLIQDTAFYRHDPLDLNNPGAYAARGGTGTDPYTLVHLSTLANPNNHLVATSGPGLPFAYDPLWRFQTISTAHGTPGYYIGDTFEARFGYGLTTIRPNDPDGNGPPSAHGLPRITNFNRPTFPSGGTQVPIMPAAMFVPNIFVSQEDVVWQSTDMNASTYTVQDGTGTIVNGPSPVIPDLNVSGGSVTLDWRYSWMFTGQLSNAGNASTFDGNIVIFENRPFSIQSSVNMPFHPQGHFASQAYQVEGETVVEAIFGYSTNVVGTGGQSGGPGYGSAADRTVLLRWPTSMPDPVVRPGDWIADVTYERQFNVVLNRFLNGFNVLNAPAGLPNFANKLEWDNLPAQRCYWYQVQKVSTPAPAAAFQGDPGPYRSMVVSVNTNLISRTVLATGGQPVYLNAALIAPNVVNVIPQTIFAR